LSRGTIHRRFSPDLPLLSCQSTFNPFDLTGTDSSEVSIVHPSYKDYSSRFSYNHPFVLKLVQQWIHCVSASAPHIHLDLTLFNCDRLRQAKKKKSSYQGASSTHQLVSSLSPTRRDAHLHTPPADILFTGIKNKRIKIPRLLGTCVETEKKRTAFHPILS
jgi:hypothetical protein